MTDLPRSSQCEFSYVQGVRDSSQLFVPLKILEENFLSGSLLTISSLPHYDLVLLSLCAKKGGLRLLIQVEDAKLAFSPLREQQVV